MAQIQPFGASNRAPLLGHNLVRLLYLDEAGADFKAARFCVAGVLVHGDDAWPEIDRRIGALIEKYVPKNERPGFVFHAKDIWHGAKFFDRRKPEWASRDKRILVLNDLAAIIEDLNLPIVMGSYRKDTFGIEPLTGENLLNPDGLEKIKSQIVHGAAVTDCLMWADKWLELYAPDELATVVHEDVPTNAKPLIKQAVLAMRNDDMLDANGMGELRPLGLPLKRIIDTVHFVEKSGARPLQLADLCAFTVARWAKGVDVSGYVIKVINEQVKWYVELKRQRRKVMSSLSGGGQPS